MCVLQEAQLFTDLLGDHGKPVWPLWELMKWLVGMSSHTLPAIGKAGRSTRTCGGGGGVGELLNENSALPEPREGTPGFSLSSFTRGFCDARCLQVKRTLEGGVGRVFDNWDGVSWEKKK